MKRLLGRILYGYLLGPIRRWTRGCNSIADVGCGTNSPLQYFDFSGQMIGIDGFYGAIEQAKARGLHDRYVQCDFVEEDLPEAIADAVVSLEVLEHLPKSRGPMFLSSLERAARKVVIISTPNGYLEQGIIDGNPYQQHLSGWEAHELRSLGYTVRGILGLKGLRGPCAAICKRPQVFWALVSRLTHVYVWARPERAFGLLCYKAVGNGAQGEWRNPSRSQGETKLRG